MKKTILSIVAVAAFTGSIVAQVPNFSFENWTSAGPYENPDMWGTMNNTTKLASIYTATKASPGNPGNFYLKLTSKTVGTSVVNGIAVSGKLDSLTMQPKSGFSFTTRPQNFTGRWQHMIYGSSQGSIMVTLTRWDTGLGQRVTVATANQVLSGMAMSWANFSLPFTYSDGGYPDTCIIVMKASGNAPTNNDYLWVDNLGFTGTVLGVEKGSAVENSISVYPNPSSGQIFIRSSSENTILEIQVINVIGEEVMKVKLTNGVEKNLILNLTTLNEGTYFIKLNTELGNIVKKIVLQKG